MNRTRSCELSSASIGLLGSYCADRADVFIQLEVDGKKVCDLVVADIQHVMIEQPLSAFASFSIAHSIQLPLNFQTMPSVLTIC